jgi:hypothetical protein
MIPVGNKKAIKLCVLNFHKEKSKILAVLGFQIFTAEFLKNGEVFF